MNTKIFLTMLYTLRPRTFIHWLGQGIAVSSYGFFLFALIYWPEFGTHLEGESAGAMFMTVTIGGMAGLLAGSYLQRLSRAAIALLVPKFLAQHYLFAIGMMLLLAVVSSPFFIYSALGFFSLISLLCLAYTIGFFSGLQSSLGSSALSGMLLPFPFLLLAITHFDESGILIHALSRWFLHPLSVIPTLILVGLLYGWGYGRYTQVNRWAYLELSKPASSKSVLLPGKITLNTPELMTDGPMSWRLITFCFLCVTGLILFMDLVISIPGLPLLAAFALPIAFSIIWPIVYWRDSGSLTSRLWLFGVNQTRQQLGRYIVWRVFYTSLRLTLLGSVCLGLLMLISDTFNTPVLLLGLTFSPLSSMIMFAVMLYFMKVIQTGTLVRTQFTLIALMLLLLLFAHYYIAAALVAGRELGFLPVFVGLAAGGAAISAKLLIAMPLTRFVAEYREIRRARLSYAAR